MSPTLYCLNEPIVPVAVEVLSLLTKGGPSPKIYAASASGLLRIAEDRSPFSLVHPASWARMESIMSSVDLPSTSRRSSILITVYARPAPSSKMAACARAIAA